MLIYKHKKPKRISYYNYNCRSSSIEFKDYTIYSIEDKLFDYLRRGGIDSFMIINQLRSSFGLKGPIVNVDNNSEVGEILLALIETENISSVIPYLKKVNREYVTGYNDRHREKESEKYFKSREYKRYLKENPTDQIQESIFDPFNLVEPSKKSDDYSQLIYTEYPIYVPSYEEIFSNLF